jgi:hypothetical protein
MREPRLTELRGTSRLALGFFNSIIRRIECTKPLPGYAISTKEQDDGIQISIDGFKEVTLNVCSNGTPDKITILAKV